MKIKNGAQAPTGSACLVKSSENKSALMPPLRRPCYRVYDHPVTIAGQTLRPGVWFHGGASNADCEDRPVDEWLCGPLHVDAITRNEGENACYGRLLRLRNVDGQWLRWVMPNELLAGGSNLVLITLLDMGLEVSHQRRAQVCQYIAEQLPSGRVIAATSTGWHTPRLFIMPQENIGHGEAIFQTEAALIDDYRRGGTLEGWQAAIGARCEGNPLLMLAICAALAGPLLYQVQRSGGGFHIVGDSSTGKSSAILAGISVWGHGEEFKRTWRATGNGLEGIASQRNDTLLALDEIGEADPREIGEVIYALANGTGKARASRTGAARASRRWRVMLFSSGEIGLSALMAEGGKRPKAGQEIRLLDISARRRHGAWDHLHGMAGGREFSDALQRASITHYGHVGPLFVRRLLESGVQAELGAMLKEYCDQYPARSGQEHRAAERFAIAAMAGELAIRFGLLPVPAGSAQDAMLGLFDGWRAGRGTDTSEDARILSSIADFIARHSDSRFSSASDPAGRARDRAGYWEELAHGGRVYLFNRPGLEEAAAGFELSRIVQALDSVEAITKHDRGKKQALKRLPDGRRDRFYFVDPTRLQQEG